MSLLLCGDAPREECENIYTQSSLSPLRVKVVNAQVSLANKRTRHCSQPCASTEVYVPGEIFHCNVINRAYELAELQPCPLC